MPEKPTTPERTHHQAPQTLKLRKFAAPAELQAEFGLQFQSEDHITGIVATEHVRDLLDAFGLQDRTVITFPFQHIKKQHGEVWRMRIEPSATHTVNGKLVNGHQWAFTQDIPERVGAAA
jgi:hypothetical protein